MIMMMMTHHSSITHDPTHFFLFQYMICFDSHLYATYLPKVHAEWRRIYITMYVSHIGVHGHTCGLLTSTCM